MTGFATYLRTLIAAKGPQPVERVMADALGHPEHGYYTQRDPFGAAGDFVTAPEISQMFGELIGLWCAATYDQMGAPVHFSLVELGPGRGTLMADALRATRRLERFRAALDVHLVETSPALRSIQRATLRDETVHWHERIEDLPDRSALIVANEFFDALPVRQLVAMPSGWRERQVALSDDGQSFRFTASDAEAPAPPTWLPRAERVPSGTIAEFSPVREAVAATIGAQLARLGGAALIIDYGHPESSTGDTLQAVRAHRAASALDTLGEADLTAHVDFAALARAAAARGARVWGPVGQGRFLVSLGIEARAARLSAHASVTESAAIEAALHRLTAPEAMGALFKALALTPANAPAPAGFETGNPGSSRAEAEALHG